MPDVKQQSTSNLNKANGSQQVPVRNALARHDSSPLMPAFMVSAPGKVIVYGEHAVVHGKVNERYIPRTHTSNFCS